MTDRKRAALLKGLAALTLALDPEQAQAHAEWLERDQERRADQRAHANGAGHHSGWRRGQPQCPSCRRLLTAANGWCPDCRMFGSSGHDHGR